MNKLPHYLGGHKGRTHIDIGIIEFAKNELKCKSMLDIGCGPGGQTYEADKLGLDAMGIDGDYTLQRDKNALFTLHDFTKGKLFLTKSYDFVWCCEFVEHVEEKYIENYLNLMINSNYIFMTYSEPGKPGHHHVNCKPKSFWINLMKKNGFIYDPLLTRTSKLKSTMKREFWIENGLVFKKNKTDNIPKLNRLIGFKNFLFKKMGF